MAGALKYLFAKRPRTGRYLFSEIQISNKQKRTISNSY